MGKKKKASSINSALDFVSLLVFSALLCVPVLHQLGLCCSHCTSGGLRLPAAASRVEGAESGETGWWLFPGSFWPCLLAPGLGLLARKALLFPGLDKVNRAMTLVHLSLTPQALKVPEEFCRLPPPVLPQLLGQGQGPAGGGVANSGLSDRGTWVPTTTPTTISGPQDPTLHSAHSRRPVPVCR